MQREHNFGLKPILDRGSGETQWQSVYRQVENLINSSAADTQYKLFFVGRHGQGVQNVAEEMYGMLEFRASHLDMLVKKNFSIAYNDSAENLGNA